MFFFFFPQLAEALKSNRSFMDLLRQDAHLSKSRTVGWRPGDRAADADRYPMIKDDLSLPSHPDIDTLHDYVLGTLNKTRMREVMDHLSACEECVHKASEIRRLDKEITKDFQNYMRSSPSDPKDSCSDDPA